MARTAHQAFRSSDDPISILTIISIGVAILAGSILIAAITIRLQDARKNRIALDDDEEVTEEEKMLPPYKDAPPAYAAELDAGMDGPFNYEDFDLKKDDGVQVV